MIIDSIGSTSSSSMSFVDISIFWDVVDPAVIVKGLWVIKYSSCFAEPDARQAEECGEQRQMAWQKATGRKSRDEDAHREKQDDQLQEE